MTQARIIVHGSENVYLMNHSALEPRGGTGVLASWCLGVAKEQAYCCCGGLAEPSVHLLPRVNTLQRGNITKRASCGFLSDFAADV